MKISIITPTYNSEQYLESCIKSIMNQSHRDYEHIIVDGGSTDRTIEIINQFENKYPVKWISEKDNGMYDAIGKGFKMASGDILCWLNSDDFYMPWTLKEVSDIFESGKVEWIVGMCSCFNESTGYSTTKQVLFPRFSIARGWMDGKKTGTIQQESSFWSKELYLRSGGLDTSKKLAGDYFLWKSFAQSADLVSVNSVFANFRIHDGQKSGDKEKYQNEIGTISLLQKVLCKLKVYKSINWGLKQLHRKKMVFDLEKFEKKL